jgi:epoxyqueuosine reductase
VRDDRAALDDRGAPDDRTILDELASEVCRIGAGAGLDAVGIAPAGPFIDTRRHLEERKAAGLHGGMQFTYRNPARSTDPSRTVAGAAALVVGALGYLRNAVGGGEADQPGPPADRPLGRVARYSWSDRYQPLRQALGAVAQHLHAQGYRAQVLADDNALVDRQAAYRAGLGWYGKNTNLLLPGRGSWYVLGAVVTEAPLPPSAAAPVDDGCGACRRCLPACPTGALIAPGVLDARRCLAWLLQAPGPFPVEYRVALGDRIYGCDDCQEVCPVNIRAGIGVAPQEAEAGDEPTVDLLGMLAATDDELLRRHGRWYIANRQPRYLRRNALIALANQADGRDPAVAGAVGRSLADADPLVRSHAVWAAARLGRHDLLTAVRGDADPSVQAELAGVGSVRPTDLTSRRAE